MRIKPVTIAISWFVTLLIIFLNIKMVTDFIFSWISETSNSVFIYAFVIMLVGIGIVLLLYTIIEPFFGKFYTRELRAPHPVAEKIVLATPNPFRKIGICVDFSDSDIRSIN